MKIRHGFVSNSSSSSFIVGIAEILDKAKFDAYIEKNNIKLSTPESYSAYDAFIIIDNSDRRDLSVKNDMIRLCSFSTSVTVERKKPGTIYFAVNVSNDGGDGLFWCENRSEMNYDIDLDYFDPEQRKLFDIFCDKDSGLNMENQVEYGASRNG